MVFLSKDRYDAGVGEVNFFVPSTPPNQGERKFAFFYICLF
jgi:hypothetical protein